MGGYFSRPVSPLPPAPDDPLLRLSTQRRLSQSSDLVSLKEACAKTILRNMNSFVKAKASLHKLPKTLLSFLMEKMLQHCEPDVVADQIVVCKFVQLICHEEMTSFDFKVCGRMLIAGQHLYADVMDTLLQKAPTLQHLRECRYACYERLWIYPEINLPVSPLLKKVVQLKSLKSIEIARNYVWSTEDINFLANELPELEKLWVCFEHEPVDEFWLDEVSRFKKLAVLRYSLQNYEGSLQWDTATITDLMGRMPWLKVVRKYIWDIDHIGHHVVLWGVPTNDDGAYVEKGIFSADVQHRAYALSHVDIDIINMEQMSDVNRGLLQSYFVMVNSSFPHLTALSITAVTDFDKLEPLLEVIGHQLKEFSVHIRSRTILTPGTYTNLAYLFKLMPHLRKLKVNGPIVPLKAESIALQTKWLAELTELYLILCPSHPEGSLVSILIGATNLKRMSLQFNDLTDGELEVLMRHLKKEECLQKLEFFSYPKPIQTEVDFQLVKHIATFCPKLSTIHYTMIDEGVISNYSLVLKHFEALLADSWRLPKVNDLLSSLQDQFNDTFDHF